MEFYKTFKNNAGQVLAICYDTDPDKDIQTMQMVMSMDLSFSE